MRIFSPSPPRGRRVSSLVALGAAMLALGACGSGGGDNKDTAGSTTSAVTAFPTIPPVTTAPAPGATTAPGVTVPGVTLPGAPTTVAPNTGPTFPPQPSTTAAPVGGGSGGSNTGTTTADGVAGQYTVKAGDCLACIAKKLGVDYQALLQVNGFNANSLITPGQKIKVPGKGTTPTTAKGATTTVKGATTTVKGATTTTAKGATTTAADAPGTYTVKRGDCLACIARQQGVDYQQLLQVNGFNASSLIVPGQKIKLPPKAGATTTTKG